MKTRFDTAEGRRKHGIDFRDVVQMFDHPMLTHLDTRRAMVRTAGSASVC